MDNAWLFRCPSKHCHKEISLPYVRLKKEVNKSRLTQSVTCWGYIVGTSILMCSPPKGEFLCAETERGDLLLSLMKETNNETTASRNINWLVAK